MGRYVNEFLRHLCYTTSVNVIEDTRMFYHQEISSKLNLTSQRGLNS